MVVSTVVVSWTVMVVVEGIPTSRRSVTAAWRGRWTAIIVALVRVYTKWRWWWWWSAWGVVVPVQWSTATVVVWVAAVMVRVTAVVVGVAAVVMVMPHCTKKKEKVSNKQKRK